MEPQPLSLLDWLQAQWGRPTVQRVFRMSAAAGALVLGGYQFMAGAGLGAYILLGLGVGLLGWGLMVRGEDAPPVGMPTLSLDTTAEASVLTEAVTVTAPPPQQLPLRPSAFPLPLKAVIFPALVLLAIVSQTFLTDLELYQHKNALLGLLGYAVAIAGFGWWVWKGDGLGAPRAADVPGRDVLGIRWPLAGVAALLGAYAFFAAGQNTEGFNEFRPSGVVAWLGAVAVWLLAVWEGPLDPLAGWARLKDWLTTETFTVRLSRAAMLLVLVLGLGVYFRFAQLDTIPPEMTSDHVEKLLDVGDLVDKGQHKVFFERNTGREPLQFYFAALIINLFHTGLTHLTLKITGAIAGFLLLPVIYLLGKELEDESFGLIATALAGISFWATAISRVGLRFPLSPVFVAPTIFFLLRGLRRGTRNDFLLAGLFLGAGLYGYSTIRVLPLVVLAAVIWFAMWDRSGRIWAGLVINTGLLFATSFVVFIPLFRYVTEPQSNFWYRVLSRMSESEQTIQTPVVSTFFSNYWNAVRMFNWQGDQVWVNTIPNMPVMDFISAALLVLGTVFVLMRLVGRRDRVTGFLPLAILILMLPSTLSFAFPAENPSVVRIGGAIPFVFLIAAYPLWLLVKQIRASLTPKVGAWAGAAVGALVIAWAGSVNHDLYFRVYPEQYRLSAENASEIGAIIDDYAHSIGSYDTAYVRPFPHWVDTRAVGMYAGDFWRDFAIQKEQLADPTVDPRSKLFILHEQDRETLDELRRLYPTGKLSFHRSAVLFHDFLIYFVPATEDFDINTLPVP